MMKQNIYILYIYIYIYIYIYLRIVNKEKKKTQNFFGNLINISFIQEKSIRK